MSDTQTLPEDALARSTSLSPALVDEIQDNVEAIQPLARGMAAVNLYNLFVNVQQSNSNKDRLELQNILNKMTGLEKAQVQQGNSGPQVIVNITRAKDSSKEVIEGVAVTLPEDNGTQD